MDIGLTDELDVARTLKYHNEVGTAKLKVAQGYARFGRDHNRRDLSHAHWETGHQTDRRIDYDQTAGLDKLIARAIQSVQDIDRLVTRRHLLHPYIEESLSLDYPGLQHLPSPVQGYASDDNQTYLESCG